MPYGTQTEHDIARVISACERYGGTSIIALSGVPGTGKSFVASIAAQRLCNEPTLVREIQFHPSYTYEEFVEGMRIDAGGGVETVPGVFLEWNERALVDRDQTYVLLIEELTRTNISSVLGELMTYVEHRERPFFTMYSRRAVRIAPNLCIIATFNPIDKSAIEIDSALLRRLRVLEFPPSNEVLSEMLSDDLSADVVRKIQKIFDTCRKEFPEDFESLMPFGHGVFSEIKAENELFDLWRQRLVKFVRNPVLGPHPFADVIEQNYPWRERSYSVSKPPANNPGGEPASHTDTESSSTTLNEEPVVADEERT